MTNVRRNLSGNFSQQATAGSSVSMCVADSRWPEILGSSSCQEVEFIPTFPDPELALRLAVTSRRQWKRRRVSLSLGARKPSADPSPTGDAAAVRPSQADPRAEARAHGAGTSHSRPTRSQPPPRASGGHLGSPRQEQQGTPGLGSPT